MSLPLYQCENSSETLQQLGTMNKWDNDKWARRQVEVRLSRDTHPTHYVHMGTATSGIAIMRYYSGKVLAPPLVQVGTMTSGVAIKKQD